MSGFIVGVDLATACFELALANPHFQIQQRKSLKRAQFEIGAVIDPVRRRALTELTAEAARSIRAVISGVHTFDVQRVDERLRDARGDVDRLLTKIGQRR